MDLREALKNKLYEYDNLSDNVNFLTIKHALSDVFDSHPEILNNLNDKYHIEDLSAKSGNKIVDKSGHALEVFHAGTGDFKNLDPNRPNKAGTVRGAFFTPNRQIAKGHEGEIGVKLNSGYLLLKNPKFFGLGNGMNYFYTQDVEELKKAGYDGIVATNSGVQNAYEIIAFYKESIKLYDNIFDAYIRSKKLGENPELVNDIESLIRKK
jgi:hypothetical protein